MWPRCFVVPSGRDLKHARKLNTHTRIYVYSSDIQKCVCSGWHHVRTDKQLKYIYTGVFIFECTTTHKSDVIHMCFDSILKWGLAKIYSHHTNYSVFICLQCVILYHPHSTAMTYICQETSFLWVPINHLPKSKCKHCTFESVCLFLGDYKLDLFVCFLKE